MIAVSKQNKKERKGRRWHTRSEKRELNYNLQKKRGSKKKEVERKMDFRAY